MRLPRRALLATILATAAPTPALAQPEPLKVLGTGAVEHPLHDLAEAFTRATGRAVLLETGNAGQVAARIRTGEAFDLVINAAGPLDGLIGARLLDGSTRIELGRVRIGLAVQDGAALPDIATPPALRATLLAAPSIALSDAAAGATTGRHLLAMFETLGIATAVAPRLQLFARGITAAEAVAAGRASLVMTQTSEIVVVPGITLVGPLPASLELVTPYVAAVPNSAADPAAARHLLALLVGETGRERFRAAGFTVE